MIICSKCGAQNPLGRLYCIKCRMKLDLQEVRTDEILEEAVSSSKRRTKFIVLLFIVIVVFVIAFLSFWPTLPPPHRYVPQEAQVAARKIELLEKGFASQQTFSEAELNSFLAALKGGSLPSKFSLQIYPDAVIVNMVSTRRLEFFGKKLGPFTFTKRLIFTLEKDGNTLRLSSGRIGHLPMPGVTAKLLLPSFDETIRSGWKNMDILKKIFIVKMGEKTIIVSVKK